MDLLTSSKIMPVLRRMNFSLVIDVDDLLEMKNSKLFTDSRHIDVHYAIITNDDCPHIELLNFLPYGSHFHPRQIASATFISDCWPDNQPFKTPGQIYVSFHLIKIISMQGYSLNYCRFFRRPNPKIDNIYFTLYHGFSMNFFNYVFQIDVLVN